MRSAGLVAYVVTVAVAAVAATAVVLRFAEPAADVGILSVLIGMALIAGARPVRLAALRTELTATHPAVLCALGALGPAPAVATSLAGLIGTTLARRRPGSSLRLTLNSAALLLLTAAAALVFTILGGAADEQVTALLGPLAAATAAYFVFNTGLVAAAIALEQHKSFLGRWQASFSWTAAAYFAGFTLAVGLLLVLESLGPWGLALGLPPTWLLVAYYRAHERRLAEKQLRIDEAERLNGELHATVERLQDALAHVKQLHGLLPICMHCKRIRDDDDTWHRIEAYISRHSAARFTHSLCAECREEHYPAGTT